MSNKDKYWIAFSSVPEADSAFIKSLYDYFKDIELAWNCSSLQNIPINKEKLEKFLRKRDKIDVDKAINEVTNRGIKYITFEDETYPYMLKNIDNPPIILYYKGDLASCNLNKTLAIVGSRRATTATKSILEKLISQFSNTDICIVSGLASGIDSTAHKSAIDNNLKTIGVIASGHDFTYPATNKYLYEKIENGYGAVVSEYYPITEALRFHFPQRNRIVTGLSYGTVVAEASLKSGALISASLCLEQGRELMCIPGLISNPNTEGIYKLLKDGATMVTCAQDILEALNWEIKPIYEQKKIKFEVLPPEQQKIINCINCEPKNFDKILSETKIDMETLLSLLTEMEINGLIKQSGGEKYEKV